MIGTEYSMTNTSFAYYSGNAWKSLKTDLQSGSIDGGNNNVRYCDFHDFYDSYLSPRGRGVARGVGGIVRGIV